MLKFPNPADAMSVIAELRRFPTLMSQALPRYRVRRKYVPYPFNFQGSDKWSTTGSGRYGDAALLKDVDRGHYEIKNFGSGEYGWHAVVKVVSEKGDPIRPVPLISVPVSSDPVPDRIVEDVLQGFRGNGRATLLRKMREASNFRILDSDVAKEITRPSARRDIYVLPSQLNGAEYQSAEDSSIVSWLSSYFHDLTGGPAGQMAVHPAIAQAIIDNAMNSKMKGNPGFLYTRAIELPVKNGYMDLNKVKDGHVFLLKKLLHLVNVLVAVNVPATGYHTRYYDKKEKRLKVVAVDADTHRPNAVDLMYASAAPANGKYGSPKRGDSGYAVSVKAAKLLLFSQYVAAFQHAARSVARDPRYGVGDYRADPDADRYWVNLRLLPIGGSAFGNNPTWIRDAILMAYSFVGRHGVGPRTAVEGHWPHPLHFVDVALVTYFGNRGSRRTEGVQYAALFDNIPLVHVLTGTTLDGPKKTRLSYFRAILRAIPRHKGDGGIEEIIYKLVKVLKLDPNGPRIRHPPASASPDASASAEML